MCSDITDVSVNGACVQKTDAIQHPSDGEIAAAVKAVVTAAEKARKDEGPGYDEVQPGQSTDDWVDSVGGSYDWIPERFKKFYHRSPVHARSMSTDLETARTEIDSGQMSDINQVDTAVSLWAGETKDAFYENFLSPFPAAVEHQQALFAELASAMYAYEAGLRSTRATAKKIADETVKTLEASGGLFGSSAEEGQLSIMIAVSVLGVISAAATGGGSLGVTFAIISGAGVVGSSSISLANAKEEPRVISGDKVDDILKSMQSALDALWNDMQNAEKGIAGYLTATLDEVKGYVSSTDKKTKRKILPHEPANSTPDITDGNMDEDVTTDPEGGGFRPRR